MIVQARKLRTTLIYKLGFTQTSITDHEHYKLLDENGKFIVQTIISKGASGKNITKGVFNAIARQIHLSSKQLEDAIRCPLSRENYYDILKDKGFNI